MLRWHVRAGSIAHTICRPAVMTIRHMRRTTGAPLGVEGLGMCCSAWLMIVNSLYGVQEDFRTIRVPKDALGRRLKMGKLEVVYPSDDSVELRTGFERQFRV